MERGRKGSGKERFWVPRTFAPARYVMSGIGIGTWYRSIGACQKYRYR